MSLRKIALIDGTLFQNGTWSLLKKSPKTLYQKGRSLSGWPGNGRFTGYIEVLSPSATQQRQINCKTDLIITHTKTGLLKN